MSTKVIIIITIIVIVTVLVFFASREDRRREQIDKQTDAFLDQLKANNPKKILTPPDVKKEQINYTRVLLSEIKNYPDSFVEVSGVVMKGALFDEDNVYIYLREGQGHAVLSISKKDLKLLSIAHTLQVGDIVSVKAYTGKTSFLCGIEEKKEYLSIKTLCDFLGAPTNAQLLLGFEGLKGDIKVTKKSNSNIKAIQAIPPPRTEYEIFQKVYVDDYIKNPPAYWDKNVRIVNGLVSDFLAAGDRGGDSNYILVIDARNPLSFSYVALQIADPTNYQKATASVNKGDIVSVYGVGEKSGSFTSATGGSHLIPVVKVLRLDGKEGIIFSKP